MAVVFLLKICYFKFIVYEKKFEILCDTYLISVELGMYIQSRLLFTTLILTILPCLFIYIYIKKIYEALLFSHKKYTKEFSPL